MATAIWSIVVVSVAVAVAVAGLILVQRLVPFSVRESHNSHTGAMFGALYVVYGLMVGFSAYLVAFQFDAAQQTVENEANSVEEIYRLAEQLPGQERREVQDLAESYARFEPKTGSEQVIYAQALTLIQDFDEYR